MRREIRLIAALLGKKTHYLVTCSGHTVNGLATATTTVVVTPWIHEGNTDDLIDHLSRAVKCLPGKKVNLLAVVRLGF